MKTMTCMQMGGPCETSFQANSADEMMAVGAAHVTELATSGDPEHQRVATLMEEMQQNPEAGDEWYKKFVDDYNSLPEDE